MSSKIFTASRSLWATLVAVPAIGLMAISLTGCNQPGSVQGAAKQNVGDEIPRVRTVTVELQDLAQSIELPGRVEGVETADLYAKVGGFLEVVSVDIGDRVKAGQVLAKLSIPEMENQLEEKKAVIASAEANARQAAAGILQMEAEMRSAQARLEEAGTEVEEKQAQLDKQQSAFERTKKLVENGSLQAKLLEEATYQRDAAQAALKTVQARIRTAKASLEAAHANVERAKTDHDSAKAKQDLAKAELATHQTKLLYGNILAPFDAVVTKRFFDRGAFIQPAEGNSAAKPLFTVTRTDVVRIILDLPMAEVRWLNRGDKAVLDRINVLPGVSFAGEVTRFASSLDRNSLMMRVEIDLQNTEQKLAPGYYGYVTLQLDEFPQTPVVPSSALMIEGNETFVYRLEGDVCRKQVVTTNYQNGIIVGIASGLEGGEQIVESGAGQLSDGQKVIAINTDAAP